MYVYVSGIFQGFCSVLFSVKYCIGVNHGLPVFFLLDPLTRFITSKSIIGGHNNTLISLGGSWDKKG